MVVSDVICPHNVTAASVMTGSAALGVNTLDFSTGGLGMTVVTFTSTVVQLSVMVHGKFMIASTRVRCVTGDTVTTGRTVGLVIYLTGYAVIDQGNKRSWYTAICVVASVIIVGCCIAHQWAGTALFNVTGTTAACVLSMKSLNIEVIIISS